MAFLQVSCARGRWRACRCRRRRRHGRASKRM